MRPAQLFPGDVLLYRNHGTLGNLIAWGEWSGKPGEALEYSHIGVVFDADQSFEMNPPAARIFSLEEVPWDRVDVWRFNIQGVNPFNDKQVTAVFQAACRTRVGQKYNYGYIAEGLGLRVLGWILPGVARWAVSKQNLAPAMHQDICSTSAEEVLFAGLKVTHPGIDLLPGVGDGMAKPSDFTLCPYLSKV